MLPNAYTDVAQTSIVKGATSAPEIYIPLWWYSGSTVINPASSSGSLFLPKGSTSAAGPTATSAKLHTLNANWSNTMNYALEAALSTANGGISVNIALWDFTTGSIVTDSQLSTLAMQNTVVRSGKFTLIPGHIYGVTIWNVNTSNNIAVTDASLIVFPS